MNQKMKSFYSASSIDFNDENLIIIPDTNILMSLYLFEDESFNSLTKSMKKSKSNFWVPYNVALEYQRNRINQVKSGEQIRNSIDNCIASVNKQFDNLIAQIESRKSNKYSGLIEAIKELHKKNKENNDAFVEIHHQSLPSPTKGDYFNDKVRLAIDDIVNDNIGDPYDKARLEEIYTDGEVRYENSIPPGFKDAGKEGNVFHYGGLCYKSKFGDLVIWHQILDFIRTIEGNKKVVFVTNDLKDDWWIKLNDIKIPHYSLKQEAINNNSNVDFDMFTADEFFKALAAFSSNKSNQARVISDINRVIEISLSKDDLDDINKAKKPYEVIDYDEYHHVDTNKYINDRDHYKENAFDKMVSLFSRDRFNMEMDENNKNIDMMKNYLLRKKREEEKAEEDNKRIYFESAKKFSEYSNSERNKENNQNQDNDDESEQLKHIQARMDILRREMLEMRARKK